MENRKKTGLFLGPLLFLVFYFLPILPENPEAHRLLAVFFLVVVFWITECVPIPVTALLIPVFITTFRIAPVTEAFAPFANPIIMLFLGGFILARAMCVHALDQKLAYSVLSLRMIQHKKSRIMVAMGLTTAFLSLWISNTATTAMMFPIALGVLEALHAKVDKKNPSPFSVALLLTLAYAASIGGIGSPIGSPPNLIAIGMLEKLIGYQITFFQWMMVGFVILIPMLLFLFVFMYFKTRDQVRTKRDLDLGPDSEEHVKAPLNKAQINVLIAFSTTVFLWVFPGVVSLIWGRETPLYIWLRAHFPDAVAAIIGACLLFFLPVNLKKGEFTLKFKDAVHVDWGTLLLFGGGLSLGFQMFETGLASFLGQLFISLGGDGASLSLICFLSIALSVFLTEVTSNTASANMLIPIIITISQAASVNPLPPVIGSAIGCSFAFMLPVATPPNAIVYGSGLIRIPRMIKTGFWLNIAGIFLIWLGVSLCSPLF
jgi:sodium-dependent dicarboxylate transporter 2/3/5